MKNKAQKGQEFFISMFEKELEDGTIFNDEVLPRVIAAHVELTTTMSKQVNEDRVTIINNPITIKEHE